jgi:hypothetical protein
MFTFIEKLNTQFIDDAPPHPILDTLRTLPLKEVPHLLLCGPSGSLAPYYVRYIVDHLAGQTEHRSPLRPFTQSITLPNNESVDFTLQSAQHYIECKPSTLSIYDKHVISSIIKPISTQASLFYDRHIFCIRDIDELSESAQFCLRRMLELYSSTMFFIMTAKTTTRICEPLRSRLLYIRFPLPTPEQLTHIGRRWLCDPERDFSTLISAVGCNIVRFALAMPEWIATGAYEEPEHIQLIHSQLETLRKSRSPWSVHQHAQDFTYMWTYYHLPHTLILQHILSYITKTFKKKKEILVYATERIAQTDHILQTSHRDFYPFISLLADLYHIMSGARVPRASV